MKKKTMILRAICVILAAALLSGCFLLLGSVSRIEPENPIAMAADRLYPETPDGSGGAGSDMDHATDEKGKDESEDNGKDEHEKEPQEEPPEEDSQEESMPQEELEEENLPEEEPDSDSIDRPTDGEGNHPGQGEGGDKNPGGTPDGGEGGNKPGGGGSGSGGEPEGPVDPDVPHIETSLYSGTIRQEDLPDGNLKFTAQGAGGEDLSVRVYYQKPKSVDRTRLLPVEGIQYEAKLTLAERQYIWIYLYQGDKLLESRQIEIYYEPTRADENNPSIGDAPFITTNLDSYEDGHVIDGTTFLLRVTATTNPGGRPIYSNHIEVRLNGKVLEKQTGDRSPEYELYFERSNVGDYSDYTVEIVAWDGVNSSYWKKNIRYHATDDGEPIGSVYVVLDATTVGLGIIDEGEVELCNGETAADILLKFLDEYGYESTYDGSPKQNFYLRRLSRGDMCAGAEVPPELWKLILRDGITLNEEGRYLDSLGEFDYTMGSGWMYVVDGSYPSRGLSAWPLNSGAQLDVRFTLSYGKDIGGYDASGGGYGKLSGYCGTWINGEHITFPHDFEETDRREPTEDKDGYIEHTCVNCGEVEKEIIPALGPDPEPEPEPSPEPEPDPDPEVSPDPETTPDPETDPDTGEGEKSRKQPETAALDVNCGWDKYKIKKRI